MGLHFRIEGATTYSLEIHILPLRSFLLFLSIDTKILKELQSKKIKESVSDDYCPTDKPHPASLPFTKPNVNYIIQTRRKRKP
jgi:hypothetical protein